ncbi:MAG: DUF3667 domain-containing protein [Proteobacteria bacterium]|nr:DUF3667 domain-containing protein [Pseudomonadota bacterium]
MSAQATGEAARASTATGTSVATVSAPGAPAAGAATCANCEAALAGPYCGQCGQRHEHAIHSFWHFMREGFEDLTHADSRLWRTLGALAWRPGFLTREFLDGRRVRYLPPVRLYLVLSVAFFLIAGILSRHPGADHVRLVEVNTSSGLISSRPVATNAALAHQVCTQLAQATILGWLGPRFEPSCEASIENGGRNVNAALLHNVPRAMFLFLPLLGLVMKGLYPRRHYVEHLLFFLHDHAFIFLVLAVYALVGLILPVSVMSVVGEALWIYVALYFFASMLRVYGEGWLATAGKLMALGFAYLVLGGLMLTAITLYAMIRG